MRIEESILIPKILTFVANKKNQMRNILLLFLFPFLSNCKSEPSVKQMPQLFADYYVRYLQTERQIKAHAAFYEGDSIRTTRPVQFSTDVIFQGNVMEPRQLSASTIRYIYNGGGDYAPGGFVFQHPDLSGKTQQRVLKMSPIENFAINGTAVRSQGITLDIQTAPFQASESLVLFFTNVRTNQAFSLEYKGLIDLPLKILPGELQNLQAGKYSLYLVKKQTVTEKSGSTDITAQVEFYSKPIEVKLEDGGNRGIGE